MKNELNGRSNQGWRLGITKYDMEFNFPAVEDHRQGQLLWNLNALYVYCKPCQKRLFIGNFKQGCHTPVPVYQAKLNPFLKHHANHCKGDN